MLTSARFIRLVCTCTVALGTTLLVSCGDLMSLFGGDDSDQRPSQGQQADQYQRAMAYKQKSDCARAIPLFEPLAKLGHGFEVAQFELGRCYLETAKTAAAPADATRTRADGASWILKAANSQVPAAQQEAIRLYQDGTGVAADPVEAGKWLLVLERNPARRVFGPAVIDPDLEKALNKKLTPAQWSEARERADRWQPVDQPTVLPPPPESKTGKPGN